MVAYYGTAGNAALGVLGEGSPDKVLPRLRSAAHGFAGDRKMQVAYELIATVAQAKPGADGDYSQMIDEAKIQRYVDQARRNKVLVILDLQPGRGNFLPQAKRMETVPGPAACRAGAGPGVADAGRKGAGQDHRTGRLGRGEPGLGVRIRPGRRAPAAGEAVRCCTSSVRSMLPDVQKIQKRPGLAMVQHVDGFGTRSEKDATWQRLRRPQQFHMGYKLFYDEDVNRYQAKDVLRFTPVPELISFQ